MRAQPLATTASSVPTRNPRRLVTIRGVTRRDLSALKLERIGTFVFALIVISVGASVALSFGMNSAADDLRAQASLDVGQTPDVPRTFLSARLSQVLAADAADASDSVKRARADELDHRADRIRELAGPASLAGLILMLATANPERRKTRSQSATSAVANTTSNGTV